MTQHTETPNLSPVSPKGEANSFWALSHLLFGKGAKHTEGDGGNRPIMHIEQSVS